MVDHVTGAGRQVVMEAQTQARRLGHEFIGCEHLLYGLARADSDVGTLLQGRGVTAERCEAEFARLISSDRGTDTGGLDSEALGSLGIDLNTVRERVDAVFGPGALAGATARPHRRRRPRSGRPGGHLPLTPQAKVCLDRSLRRAEAADTGGTGSLGLGAEHIALELFAMDAGIPHGVLSALGVSAPRLRSEILGNGRSAGPV